MGLVKREKSSDVAKRAWNKLRLVLLWASKGGVVKRRLMTDLRLFPKFVRSLGHHDGVTPRQRYRYYGERQMSFDRTPVFPAVKFNGSSSIRLFPCLNAPEVDFDCELDDEYDVVCDRPKKSFLSLRGDCEFDDQDQDEFNNIDSRAEKFIAEFYDQIKMQRQISYLHRN